MKLFPLIAANLLGFLRNWKSLTLLLITPLIVITLIFLSINIHGLQKIPVGVINQPLSDLDATQRELLESYLLKEYPTHDACIASLRQYEVYLCVKLESNPQLRITLIFDNTREPVIWEVLQKIKLGFDFYKQKLSRSTVSTFINEAGSAKSQVQDLKQSVGASTDVLQTYILEVEEASEDISSTRSDSSQTLSNMAADLSRIRTARNTFEGSRLSSYNSARYSLDSSQQYLDSMKNLTYQDLLYKNYAQTQISTAQQQVNYYDDVADSLVSELDSSLYNYDVAYSKGQISLGLMSEYQRELAATARNLQAYKVALIELESRLSGAEKKLINLSGLDAGSVLNPLSVVDSPAYVPKVETKKTEEISATQAMSMLSLQTLFPTVFFLIILFLSLLISTFVALREIHAPANMRLVFVKYIASYQLLATAISSLVLIAGPIFCLMLAGEFLFQLNLFENIVSLTLVVVMVSLSFIGLGMTLAYVVRNESITLLLSTFILIAMMFFSGFILPIERMNTIFFTFVQDLPSKLGVDVFNKLIFYNVSISSHDFAVLLVWFISIFIICALAKARQFYVFKTL